MISVKIFILRINLEFDEILINLEFANLEIPRHCPGHKLQAYTPLHFTMLENTGVSFNLTS